MSDKRRKIWAAAHCALVLVDDQPDMFIYSKSRETRQACGRSVYDAQHHE